MTNYWQGPISDSMATFLQQGIREYAYASADALAYFNDFGLIDPIPRGAPKVKTTKFDKMAPGQISFGVEHLPISKAHAVEVETTVAILGTIIQLNKLDIDLWREQTSPHIQSGDMMAKVIAEQMQSFIQQVDNFLFWGDDMMAANIIDNDRRLNSGTFTGILNGFTNLAGGAGADDNMSAANDYDYYATAAIKALKQGGHNLKQYLIFSDMNTWQGARSGNNFYSTVGGHESDLVIARRDIAAWIASPNAYDNTETDYRIAVVAPEMSRITKAGKVEKGKFKPHRLLRGYNFELVPIFGGQYDMDMNSNIGLLVSLALEETYAKSIQRTGALTL